MPVSQPELYTEQIGENTWIAYCDGFEAMGGTESESIDAVFVEIDYFLKLKAKHNAVLSSK